MLETLLQSIKSIFSEPSYWYNFFAILLAIGGLLYGIIKDYFQNKKKEPVYWIRTTHLVRKTTKNVEGLQLLYNGHEVADLSTTKFVFWNKGKEAIKRSDIASKNPIKITIDPEYEILDVYIDSCTNDDNNFTTEKQNDCKSILINFEFMEQNDGVSLKITHTAPNSDKFKVSGKVISGMKIAYTHSVSYAVPFFSNRLTKTPKGNYHFTKLFMIFVGLLLIITSFLLEGKIVIRQDLLLLFVRYGLLLSGLFYFYTALFVIRMRIPDKLDIN